MTTTCAELRGIRGLYVLRWRGGWVTKMGLFTITQKDVHEQVNRNSLRASSRLITSTISWKWSNNPHDEVDVWYSILLFNFFNFFLAPTSRRTWTMQLVWDEYQSKCVPIAICLKMLGAQRKISFTWERESLDRLIISSNVHQESRVLPQELVGKEDLWCIWTLWVGSMGWLRGI